MCQFWNKIWNLNVKIYKKNFAPKQAALFYFKIRSKQSEIPEITVCLLNDFCWSRLFIWTKSRQFLVFHFIDSLRCKLWNNPKFSQYRIVCRKGFEMAVFKHLSRIFITTSNGYLFVWFVCAIVNVFGLYFWLVMYIYSSLISYFLNVNIK